MAILYRPVPLSAATGKIQILFEDYERERILDLLKNGVKLQVVIDTPSVEVSDEIRGFFYGHVFKWVASIYEKHTQEVVTCNKVEFGKSLLKAIYDEQKGKFEFCGVGFEVDKKPLSFSRNDSTKRLMEATDIWTLWFANNLGETFPIPDKLWKLNKQ